MTVYDCQLVMLPDGTAWLRREDVMVKWPGEAPEFAAVAIEEPRLPAPKSQRVLVHQPTPTTPRPSGHRKGGKPTPRALYDEAKRLFTEGMPISAIAKQVGLPDSTLYYRAKVDEWRQDVPATEPVARKKRRCPSCEQITFLDPCAQCGVPIAPKGGPQ